jgi:hypothetical protein
MFEQIVIVILAIPTINFATSLKRAANDGRLFVIVNNIASFLLKVDQIRYGFMLVYHPNKAINTISFSKKY